MDSENIFQAEMDPGPGRFPRGWLLVSVGPGKERYVVCKDTDIQFAVFTDNLLTGFFLSPSEAADLGKALLRASEEPIRIIAGVVLGPGCSNPPDRLRRAFPKIEVVSFGPGRPAEAYIELGTHNVGITLSERNALDLGLALRDIGKRKLARAGGAA